MGIVACIVGLVIAGVYVTWQAKRQTVKGVGYVVSGTDSLTEEDEKSLPPFWSSILPLVIVVVMMIFLKDIMGATDCILTALCVAIVASIVLNPKVFFGAEKNRAY